MKETKYRDEYKIEIDETGKKPKKKAVYNGDYYVLEGGAERLKGMRKLYTVYACSMLLLYFVGAIFDFSGSRTLYVIIPYAFAILPLAYMTVGVVKLWFLEPKMEHFSYDTTVLRVHRSCKAVMILSAAAAACEIVYMFTSTEASGNVRDYIFIASMVLVALISYSFMVIQKSFLFSKSK